MALQILIDINDYPVDDPSGRQQGDIICAKLDSPGTVWGNAENREFAISVLDAMDISDQNLKNIVIELEQALQQMKNNGDNHPVITYPFARYETIDEVTGEINIVEYPWRE